MLSYDKNENTMRKYEVFFILRKVSVSVSACSKDNCYMSEQVLIL